MGVQFSEDIWEQISSLWGKKQEQADGQLEYHDPQVRHLLRIMFMARQAMKAGEKEEYDTEKAWKAIEKETLSRRQISVWYKYAAAVVVILFAGWFWTEYRKAPEIRLATDYTDTIRPGSQKAELILANGERIVLGNGADIREVDELGIKITPDLSGGQLRYEADEIKDHVATEYNTLIVPKGGEYCLVLPDGSQVWLNAETTLRFPVQFSEKKREVELEGEAYFKIRHNPRTPFHVYTKRGEITVLGTSFNVSSYEGDKYWQTTLVEGSVKINSQGQENLLKPAQQYSIDCITGQRSIVKVDTDIYTSWVEGKFYFKAYAFEEIVKKLERWYDFTMEYEDEEVKQMRFTGTINKHRPITETLRFLEMTTAIRFKMEGKKIIVSKI